MALVDRCRSLGRILLLAAFSANTGCSRRLEPQPDIRLASIAQLRAIVPNELKVDSQEDEAAEARYKALINLGRTLNEKDVVSLSMNSFELSSVYAGHSQKGKVSKADQQALVTRIWRAHPQFLTDLAAILRSGPLAFPSGETVGRYDDLALVNVTRLLAFSAVSYGAFGNFKLATNMIVLSYKLDDRLIAATGGITD